MLPCLFPFPILFSEWGVEHTSFVTYDAPLVSSQEVDADGHQSTGVQMSQTWAEAVNLAVQSSPSNQTEAPMAGGAGGATLPVASIPTEKGEFKGEELTLSQEEGLKPGVVGLSGVTFDSLSKDQLFKLCGLPVTVVADIFGVSRGKVQVKLAQHLGVAVGGNLGKNYAVMIFELANVEPTQEPFALPSFVDRAGISHKIEFPPGYPSTLSQFELALERKSAIACPPRFRAVGVLEPLIARIAQAYTNDEKYAA